MAVSSRLLKGFLQAGVLFRHLEIALLISENGGSAHLLFQITELGFHLPKVEKGFHHLIPDRPLRVRLYALCQIADTGFFGDVNLATVCGDAGGDHFQKGGFSCPVGSDETDPLLFFHFEADSLQDRGCAEGFVNMIHLQNTQLHSPVFRVGCSTSQGGRNKKPPGFKRGELTF